MTLEWLRRHDDKWDEQLRNYLFTDKPILEREEELEEGDVADGGGDDGSLGIGSLK